jgi:ATP adenylyltransferase
MTATHAPLEPGTLWSLVQSRTQHALAAGTLRPIETTQAEILDGGVRFQVRRISSLAHKPPPLERAPRAGPPANPFLPYEQDLFVADLSPTHLALLNKYPVLAHHLLIVTRRFEHQDTLLNTQDWQALARCMAEIDGLGFYNGGTSAGASQLHKHLQLVPLIPAAAGSAVPIEPLLAAAPVDARPDRVPGLPFEHAVIRLSPGLFTSLTLAGEELFAAYCALCHATGLGSTLIEGDLRQAAPYNLLLTRDWMLLVPRSQECAGPVSINALGFAGSLFVKDEAQMAFVREHGPMQMLRETARAVTR